MGSPVVHHDKDVALAAGAFVAKVDPADRGAALLPLQGRARPVPLALEVGLALVGPVEPHVAEVAGDGLAHLAVVRPCLVGVAARLCNPCQ